MSLVAGQVTLQASLATQFANTTPENTAPVAANNISGYVMAFAQTGVPLTSSPS